MSCHFSLQLLDKTTMRQGCRSFRTQRLCTSKSGFGMFKPGKFKHCLVLRNSSVHKPVSERWKQSQNEKTQRWWPESFQSQEQIYERTWHRITDWLGLETMVWMQGISIDPYQGRSQAENQCVPIIGFRPVRDRLSPRSFIKRQLRPVFLRSQASTHRPKRGFGKNRALRLLVVSFT